MTKSLSSLLGTQIGHFVFESGHHGNLWLDLDRLFERPALLRPFITQLGQLLMPLHADAVCGPMTGGAFIANMLASEFDLQFVFTERICAIDTNLKNQVTYRLPESFRPNLAGRRVAVVDDVINAGSAVNGSIASLSDTGAEIVAIGSLIALERGGIPAQERLTFPLFNLISLQSDLWNPADCPLCQSGIKIDLDLSN